jgi:hypothetical protein
MWVLRTPERSWKSNLTLRAQEEEDPGERGRALGRHLCQKRFFSH